MVEENVFKGDSPDVIVLDTLADLENDETPTEANNQPERTGGSVTWHSSVVTSSELNCVACSWRIIKTPDRLMYAPLGCKFRWNSDGIPHYSGLFTIFAIT